MSQDIFVAMYVFFQAAFTQTNNPAFAQVCFGNITKGQTSQQ